MMIKMDIGTGGVSTMVRTQKNAGVMVQKMRSMKAGLIMKTMPLRDFAREQRKDALFSKCS